MHEDFSLFESANRYRLEKSFGIALGRVVKVFPKERICQVQTFHGSGNLGDNFIDRCQWVNMDSNPEGDEATIIPRKNSLGLVFFVEGQAFIFGFFKPLRKSGSAAQGNEPSNLLEGDKVISTIAGNRITVKSNGIVELFSKDTLKRIQFPTESKLVEICSKYDLRTDGGAVLWDSDDDTQETLCKSEFRRDLLRTVVLLEERGAAGGSTILRTSVGPAKPGAIGTAAALYESSVDVDGSATLKVGPVGNVTASASSTGAFNLSVNSLTGLSIGETGSVSLDVNKLTKLDIADSGDVTIKTTGATVTISTAGEVTIKALGQVAITGGGLAPTESPLTFPTTVSHFTGLPLSPGSQTVKISK